MKLATFDHKDEDEDVVVINKEEAYKQGIQLEKLLKILNRGRTLTEKRIKL